MKKIISLLFVLVLSGPSFGEEEANETSNRNVPPFDEDDLQWSLQSKYAESGAPVLVYGGYDIEVSEMIDRHLNYCAHFRLTTLACEQSKQHQVSVQYLRIHDEQIGLLHKRLEALEPTFVPDTGTYELLDVHDTFIGWWTFGDDNTASIAVSGTEQTLLYRYTDVIPLVGTPENASQYITYDCIGFQFARFTDTNIDPLEPLEPLDPTDYLWVKGADIGFAHYIDDAGQLSGDLERPMYEFIATDGKCERDGHFNEIDNTLSKRAYGMGYSTLYMQHPKPWRLGEARSD